MFGLSLICPFENGDGGTGESRGRTPGDMHGWAPFIPDEEELNLPFPDRGPGSYGATPAHTRVSSFSAVHRESISSSQTVDPLSTTVG